MRADSFTVKKKKKGGKRPSRKYTEKEKVQQTSEDFPEKSDIKISWERSFNEWEDQ